MNDKTTGADLRSRQPLIVLDRGGVINRDSESFIKSPDEWIAIPGSPEAIGRLNEAGFTVIPVFLVRTGNGLQTERQLPPDRPVKIFDALTAVADYLTA